MISIIVPVYNRGYKIVYTVDGLFEQKIDKKYEIIVADDGSTDDTLKHLEYYKVKVIKLLHEGPAHTRNWGVKYAKGNIVVFTDADCYPEKNWLEEMVKPFNNPEIAGVLGAYKTKQTSLISRFVQQEIEERYESMKKVKYIDFMGSYSTAYRKQYVNFDESYPHADGEDTALSFKLAKEGKKMVFNPNAIVYHEHISTLKDYLKQKFWRAFWRMKVYKQFKNKRKGDSYTPRSLPVSLELFVLSIVFLLAIFFVGSVGAYFGFFLALFATLWIAPPSYQSLVRIDKKFIVYYPIIILLRSFVMCTGLLIGGLRFLWRD